MSITTSAMLQGSGLMPQEAANCPSGSSNADKVFGSGKIPRSQCLFQTNSSTVETDNVVTATANVKLIILLHCNGVCR